MKKINMAIVGCGTISDVTFPGYLKHPSSEIYALCDPLPERAESAAKRFGINPVIYTRYEDVLDDPKIDAVELLTPTHLHPKQSIEALQAGKHVSTQKPIGPTVADADAVAKVDSSTDVMFRETENFLYYPPLIKAKELIDSGAIGDLSSIRMRTFLGQPVESNQSSVDVSSDALKWRSNPKDNPGGLIYDSGWHKFATAIWIAGEAESVSAIIVKTDNFYLEHPAAVIWKHANKECIGILESVYASEMKIRGKYYPVDDFFEFQGSHGSIWVTRSSGEMYDLPPVLLFKGTETHSFNVPSDWVEGFNGAAGAFIDSILENKQELMDANMAKQTLQLTLAPYLSSASKKHVDPRTIS